MVYPDPLFAEAWLGNWGTYFFNWVLFADYGSLVSWHPRSMVDRHNFQECHISTFSSHSLISSVRRPERNGRRRFRKTLIGLLSSTNTACINLLSNLNASEASQYI